ncbi:UNVERIFIED_CONTAM: hypothetical protein Sangu_2342300 [Sesamum angustifolium]|uniref:Uncharacterized protein n=1 Tax=Sesamum angustifolium TaxID=2727405 RepID=A0AAW2L8S4_9LAMI
MSPRRNSRNRKNPRVRRLLSDPVIPKNVGEVARVHVPAGQANKALLAPYSHIKVEHHFAQSLEQRYKKSSPLLKKKSNFWRSRSEVLKPNLPKPQKQLSKQEEPRASPQVTRPTKRKVDRRARKRVAGKAGKRVLIRVLSNILLLLSVNNC